jgi:hypothetical protein
MHAAIIALALVSAAAVPTVPVSVASGDWSNIPAAQKRGLAQVSTSSIEKFEAALTGDCKAETGVNRQLELNVPFLIRFGTDGSVQEVVVHRLNCPSAEAVLGGAVLQLARTGEYRPTGENLTGWYRGEFSLQSRQP